jgi:prophage DNA circulation protein
LHLSATAEPITLFHTGYRKRSLFTARIIGTLVVAVGIPRIPIRVRIAKPSEAEIEEETVAEETVITIKESVTTIKEAVTTIKEPVPTIKESVTTIKEAVPTIKEAVTAIEEAVPTINKTVAAKATEIATSKTALANTKSVSPKRTRPHSWMASHTVTRSG